MFVSAKNGQNAADELKSVLNRDVNIIDRSGVIIASTDASRIGRLHSGAKKLIENNLDALTVYADDSESGVKAGINLPISIDGEVQGVIGVTGRPEELLTPAGVIKKMTELMLINLRRQEEKLTAENRKRLFYEYWLTAEAPEERALAERAAMEGIDLARVYAVAVFRASDKSEIEGMISHAQEGVQGFCFEFREDVVLVVSAHSRRAIDAELGRIGERLKRTGNDACCGASVAEGKSMAQCYKEAREALLSAHLSGAGMTLYDEADLDFILKNIPEDIREKLKTKLGAGLAEEELREARHTVRLFFECGGDVEKMADTVYVHKNTIYYRLKQVKKLTGCSLSVPREAFLLYIWCM